MRYSSSMMAIERKPHMQRVLFICHGNNKRSGKAGALAGTGDVNAPLTAAAAALAAVGAGLVAYSARRTALEIDTADEVNSDRPR